jgi:hypothetical protein
MSELKEKQQIEESNRDFVYQVQELKDMLDGQQNSNKVREDEVLHWKKVTD